MEGFHNGWRREWFTVQPWESFVGMRRLREALRLPYLPLRVYWAKRAMLALFVNTDVRVRLFDAETLCLACNQAR
jgi:hypothetical protein